MKKFSLLLVVFMLLLCGCSCNKETPEKYTFYSTYVKAYSSKESSNYILVDPFGTYLAVSSYNESKAKEVEEEFKTLVSKYHSLFDRNYYYKDDEGNFINNLKVINDSYGSGNSVTVDKELINILKEGIKYSKLSNGKFNIASGSIVDVWEERFDYYSSNYQVDPTSLEVNEAMKCVPNYNDLDSVIVIDEVNNTVTFNSFSGCSSGASITLGALAKSYFLNIITSKDEFKALGSSLYDAGQSSIVVKGENPIRSDKKWYVGVSDSLNKGNSAFQLKVNGGKALSTSSGDYKGYVNDDGVRRIHIIDATSGYSSNYLIATTIVGDDAMICDIATTTIMTMNNLEEIKNYLITLENNGIKLGVSLQIEKDGNLQVMVNEEMKQYLGDNYLDNPIEEFSYGA